MSHNFVACDAATERQNRACAFANQQVFKHAWVQHAWSSLDIEDESTWEYINSMEISELERKKFEADVLTSNVHPNIKFLKAEEDLLPFVVRLRAPRGRGDFNQRNQQRNNNWTRQNFVQQQNFEQRADAFQAPQNFNYPMHEHFSGPLQTPPMAVPISSAPVNYVPVNHGYNNTFFAAPMQNGYSQSNQPNGGYYPFPTESRDSGVYTSSPSNAYEGSHNIQYIPASDPRDVPYASVIPPEVSQIYDPSQGVPPQSVDFNYPMQQYYSGPSQAVPWMAGKIPQGPFGYVPVNRGYNNTLSAAPMQNGYNQNILPNGGHYPCPTESRDSGVYTSSLSNGSEGCQNFQQVLASSPSDDPYASVFSPEASQIHDSSPSRSLRQDAHRKVQTANAKPLIQTTIKVEPNYESNLQVVSGQHEEPQLTVEDDNGNKDTPQQVSDDVSTLQVVIEKPAEFMESTDFDTEKTEKHDTSNEATVTLAKQRNSESGLPTAPESAEFVEKVKPLSIGTTVEDNTQTTTELVLEQEGSIVTDDVSGASNKDLNCDVSKLKPVQSMECSDFDAEGLKDQFTSDEATLTLVPHAHESAIFVVEAKLLPIIETTAVCDIQTTIEFQVEMNGQMLVQQHKKPQMAVEVDKGKIEPRLQISRSKDVDTRPNVADDTPGASNTESDPSKLEKPVLTTPMTPIDTETKKLKGKITDDGPADPYNSDFIIPYISKLAEDLEFPSLTSKASDSVVKCLKDADVPTVENEKPIKPLMSEVLLAAIEKEKGTVNPCLNAAPILQRNICQKENKNLKSCTNSQASEATSLSQIKKSEKQFYNKKLEPPTNHLPAKQEQDSTSGWKTVKGSSKDTNNNKKLAVSAEQPPVAKDSKKSPSSKELKASTTSSSISPTLKTEQSVKEILAESFIDTPDQPEKSQITESSQKKSMRNKKKVQKAKAARPSVIEDFDTLLKQFKEEDRKSAEKKGEVREVVFEKTNGNKKKRTIRQYQAEKWQYEAEKEEAERNGQELIDSFENVDKRLEICVNFGLPLFFVELDDCVKNRSPMFNWPECPVRDFSESDETTRDRDELVLRFINIRILDQFKGVGTTCVLQDKFYSFLGRHYNSNLGPILEPLARIRMEREIILHDDWELIVRMLNKREHRAEWKEFNFHYMRSTDKIRFD
ncbi:hypothetical protein L3Y34_013120 [Caenorhabditis briggsae]|uniref:Uncharacterized protein n=1 Tax=Caenorhabditis briggsae TaxID=6238 RepID=A0AAE8ZT15_CAEBR|nr:hypothetical protein L3Y34_013120 [Caenorhabditis briggsae]